MTGRQFFEVNANMPIDDGLDFSDEDYEDENEDQSEYFKWSIFYFCQ